MTVRDVAMRMGLKVVCGEENLGREIQGGYVGDLLSDVIAHSESGQLWLTVQVHLNIVAVAVLKDLSAILIVNGRTPAADTVQRAVAEKVPLLVSTQPAFRLAGELAALGVMNEV